MVRAGLLLLAAQLAVATLLAADLSAAARFERHVALSLSSLQHAGRGVYANAKLGHAKTVRMSRRKIIPIFAELSRTARF